MVPTVQSHAYCPVCWDHFEPSELQQSWRARDEYACPDCHRPLDDEYVPDN